MRADSRSSSKECDCRGATPRRVVAVLDVVSFAQVSVFLAALLFACSPRPPEVPRATLPERVMPWPTRVATGVRRIQDASMLCAEGMEGWVRCWTRDPGYPPEVERVSWSVRVASALSHGRIPRREELTQPLDLELEFHPRFVVFDWPDIPSPFDAADPRRCRLVAERELECWPPPEKEHACTEAVESCTLDLTGRQTFPAAVLWGQVAYERGPILVGMGSRYEPPHACALMEDRTVRCWRAGSVGQLGDGQRNHNWASTTLVEGLGNVEDLALGANHTCALHDGGRVSCWGYDEEGQLGSGRHLEVVVPRRLMRAEGVEGATQIYAGNQHSCSMGAQGLMCWGDDYARGIASDDRRPRAHVLPEQRQITSVVLGAKYLCVLDASGDVWCGGAF